MRILYFTRDYTPHDYRFLSALAKTEHKVYYLRLEQQAYPTEDRAMPPEIELVNWAGGSGPAHWQDGLRLLNSFKEVIRRVKPDIVQAGPIQRSAFLAALSGFRPLISMSWGYDLIRDAQRNALWGWATRYTLQHCAVMVGDCDTIRQLAISFGMPDRRIVTFPWGVDLEHFSPSPQGGPGDARDGTGLDHPLTLLSTRAWEPIYGVDVIARAFVIAARQLPGLRLVMLGNGSQASLIHKIFSEAGVSERVQFPGLVRQAELPRFYRCADLYVSASHSDGTSISLLEAMACGIPLLLSDIPGNREWVKPGVQGWLFPDSDARALAQAILQAASQRQRLGEMGEAARRLAEARADWRQNFQQMLSAYDLALNNKLNDYS
jgi:glycosyltransferase involved in cell wall biosynthesis